VSTKIATAVLALSFAVAAPGSSLADGDFFEFEGHFELDIESERNFDLDSSASEDVANVRPELELGFALNPDDSLSAVLVVEAKRRLDITSEDGGRERELELEIEEAFIEWEPTDYLGLIAGRQDFDDEREWIYDENLDGLRIVLGFADAEIEISATREASFQVDVLNPETDDDTNNYHVYGRYGIIEDLQIAAYWLHRHDRTSGEDHPTFYGLRSLGEDLLDERLNYWIELALVDGREGALDLSGYGFDVGATYIFDLPHTPYLTFAYAFGSGDEASSAGTDDSFRQTGLQDNDDKFGGVASFKYYGEVLDPELSNITIYTAAIGFRPTEKSSFDVIYHHYEQDELAAALRDSSLDIDPNGLDRELGSALDLVLAHREIENVRLEAVLGVFFPGDAFPDADKAFFTGIEARYSF
jgi:alginate production protein